ncbi:GSCOCG00006054001-RA-CDS [Cotesia congregata]|nr:GSCOCG00006054001-RA-CDS [Cotesia congregata]
MPRHITVIILAGVALILCVNAAQTDPPTTCVEFGGTCDQHRRCCGENLKCDRSNTVSIYKCKEKAKLGDSCRETFHCIDIVHSVCLKNKCVCRQKNVRASDYACIPILNGYCWKNETCATENSLCINNKCQCRDGFVAEANECLPVVIGSKCNDDAACKSVKFAEFDTFNKVCACSENAIAINERMCLVRLGGICQANEDCAAKKSWCDENKCQCRAQYFAYSEIECRLTFIGMPCNVSNQCHAHSSDSYCYNKTCQCELDYLLKNENSCLPGITSYCSTTDECSDPESICIGSWCQCRTNYVMRESKCLPKQLKGRCSKNSDCSEVKFAMCLNGQCTCTAGFFAVNATCTAAVGGPCITNKDCTVRFSHCFEQTCKCNRNYIQYSESQCVATELGTTCSDQITCSMIKKRALL